LELQEQLKTETHVSEAAFRSLKFEEDESKTKRRQIQKLVAEKCDLDKRLEELRIEVKRLETKNNDSEKQLEEKEAVLKSNNEKQKQAETVIDGLRKDVASLNQTVQILRTYTV
jgi:chromosome segregation ATPase